MDEAAPPSSIADLTIDALDDRRKRWDWDWVICSYIRAWEACLKHVYGKQNPGLRPYGAFGWYHWHEICDRAFFRATADLDALEEAVRVEGDEATDAEAQLLHRRGREILSRFVAEECASTWETMNERLEARGMDLYGPA